MYPRAARKLLVELPPTRNCMLDHITGWRRAGMATPINHHRGISHLIVALRMSVRRILSALGWPEPPLLSPAQPVVETEAGPRRLAYIDVDHDGLFARLVHATSSAHHDGIKTLGLMPLGDMRQAVGDYMLDLAPAVGTIEGGVDAILDRPSPQLRHSMGGQFLYGRLETEAGEPCIHMLPLLGGDGYLNSAADNAVKDGGEIFKAARLVLAEHLGRPICPRYPDATALVVVSKHRFREEGGFLHLEGVDGYPPVATSEAVPTAFLASCAELRVQERIQPGCLELVSHAEYRTLVLERASKAAETRLRTMRDGRGAD